MGTNGSINDIPAKDKLIGVMFAENGNVMIEVERGVNYRRTFELSRNDLSEIVLSHQKRCRGGDVRGIS